MTSRLRTRVHARFALALCVGAALGCADGADPISPADREGWYRLELRNGQAPPVTVSEVYGGVTITSIRGGEFVLMNGKHGIVIFITGTDVSGAAVNQIALSETAPASHVGNRVILPVTGHPELTGTFSGSGDVFDLRLTVPFPAAFGTLVFVRSLPGCRDLC